MGTAGAFDQILHSELNIHAAWLPITNAFRLGDYGLISNGVLAKMGNLDEFGITFREGIGPDAKLNFTSRGTRITKIVGNTEVNLLPDQGINAKMIFEFDRDNSFLLKATLTVLEIQNINEVARQLATTPDWKRRFRVVWGIYTGRHSTIISSTAPQSKIELSGKANALKEFDLGNAAVGITASSSDKIGIELIGRTGVVGLALFKLPLLPWPFGDVPKVLGEEDAKFEIDADWPKVLPDDI